MRRKIDIGRRSTKSDDLGEVQTIIGEDDGEATGSVLKRTWESGLMTIGGGIESRGLREETTKSAIGEDGRTTKDGAILDGGAVWMGGEGLGGGINGTGCCDEAARSNVFNGCSKISNCDSEA